MAPPRGRFTWRFVYRSSINGRFVTEKFALAHKDVTERQRIRFPW